MTGGSLTISVDNYAALAQVAQAVTCWAGGPSGANVRKISTTSSGPFTAIRIPEELSSIGALALKRDGADLWSGYIVGSHAVYNAANGTVMETNANTCPARTNQPTVTSFTTNVGGNPLATSLVYANVTLAGTVSINFGDGTILTAQAEAATVAHTFPHRGTFTITISDTTVPTDSGSFVVVV